MMAPTNDTVVALNLRAQQRRADAGEIDLAAPSVAAGPYRIVAGDVVATRRNDRDLRTDRGLTVKNRDQWEVLGVHPGGAVSVSGSSGVVRLPAGYVAEHLELAYAQTSHANQGRTVDCSFLLLDAPTDTRGVYVPLTRGRHANEAFVVTEGEQTARDVLAEALARDWIDEPAIARRAQLLERARDAGGRETERPLPGAAVRELLEREHAITETLRQAEFRVRMYGEQLARATSRHHETERDLAKAEARRHDAQQVIDELDHPLRRRMHRDDLRDARLTVRQEDIAIGGYTKKLATLESQIADLESTVAQAKQTLRGRPSKASGAASGCASTGIWTPASPGSPSTRPPASSTPSAPVRRGGRRACGTMPPLASTSTGPPSTSPTASRFSAPASVTGSAARSRRASERLRQLPIGSIAPSARAGPSRASAWSAAWD